MKSDIIYVGIDPGLHGAVAGLDINGELVYLADIPAEEIVVKRQNRKAKEDPTLPKTKMGKKRILLVNDLRDVLKTLSPKHVGLEEQHAMPGQGVTSMFSTGYGFGVLIGLTSALNIPVVRFSAAEWTSRLLKGSTGEGKDRSLSVSRSMFPHAERLNKSNGRADALLIAFYTYLRCRQLSV